MDSNEYQELIDKHYEALDALIELADGSDRYRQAINDLRDDIRKLEKL